MTHTRLAVPELRRWVVEAQGGIAGFLCAFSMRYRIDGQRVPVHTLVGTMLRPLHGCWLVSMHRCYSEVAASCVAVDLIQATNELEKRFLGVVMTPSRGLESMALEGER